MKVIPGGPADGLTFPTESPAISSSATAGHSGANIGSTEVWLDGTVRFTGWGCERPRQAKMAPAAVENLISQLDRRAHVFSWSTREPDRRCCDCSQQRVRVRARGKDVVNVMQCRGGAAPLTTAIGLIGEMVGPNPCATRK